MNTSSTAYSPAPLTSNFALLPKLARSHNSAFKPVSKLLSSKALRKTQSWLSAEKKKGALHAPFKQPLL